MTPHTRETTWGAAAQDARRRVLVIHNPAAGPRRRARLQAGLAALAAYGVDVDLRETQAAGDAVRIAREAAADPDPPEMVVAAGGDGTVNEVVNGLLAAGGPAPPTFGLFALGTANVLAREIALPRALDAQARVIAHGRIAAVRVGAVHADGAPERLFTAMASCGFDARVVDGVSLALKRRIGSMAYTASALRELAGGPREPLELTIDGRAVRAHGAIVANGRFYGLGYVCAPRADIARPGFEVVLLERGGRIAVLRQAAALLRGTLCAQDGVSVTTATEVTLGGPAGAAIQADGDIVARVPATIRVVPRVLSIAVSPESPLWPPRRDDYNRSMVENAR